MIAVLSPAKTLDFETAAIAKKHSIPDHLNLSEQLIEKLARFSSKKLVTLMDLSEKLADLNVERYQTWHKEFDLHNAKQAILAFKGDVYLGLDANTFKEKDFTFAQNHLLILSGLHGYLRPLDLIQPYRLEMGTNMSIGKAKNLYQFWDMKVNHYIDAQLSKHKDKTLINLASEEYFKVVKEKSLQHPCIHCEFKDKKGSDYKMIGFFAKKARGYMASYMVKNKIEKTKDLKDFNEHGYVFNSKLSKENQWVFTREKTE
ncbi:MAG: peroxide stress protein YaaA [Bacteroidota bacterium]